MKKKSAPKKCTQTSCCFFGNCKYGHDTNKCRMSTSFAGSNAEVVEIS